MEAAIRRDVNVSQAGHFKSTIHGDSPGIWLQGAKDQDLSDGNHTWRGKVPPLYHTSGLPSSTRGEEGGAFMRLRLKDIAMVGAWAQMLPWLLGESHIYPTCHGSIVSNRVRRAHDHS